jgi:hypothetical protein
MKCCPPRTWAINTKEHSLTKTAPFTLFFGRAASPWSDYSSMELSFVRSEEQMRTQVELQPADVERLKKQADEFDRQVRQPVLEGARERQDQANKRLDGKRKAFDPRIKPA